MHTHKSVTAFLLLTLSTGTALKADGITLRPATLSDLENALPKLVLTRTSPAQFDYISDTTEQTILEILNITYRPLIDQEINFFKSNQASKINLIVECNGMIVGFFSAQATETPKELFVRWIVCNQAYSRYNMLKLFVQETFKTLPDTQALVFLLKATNKGAQNYFESLGAQKIENAPWKQYLYDGLNPQEFIGYRFERDTIEKFINS